MASPDDRPPMALAIEWVSRITTVALEMVVPGLIGQWLDHRWQTQFLGPAGFVLGVAAGMWHLLRMTAAQQPGKKRKAQPPSNDSTTKGPQT